MFLNRRRTHFFSYQFFPKIHMLCKISEKTILFNFYHLTSVSREKDLIENGLNNSYSLISITDTSRVFNCLYNFGICFNIDFLMSFSEPIASSLILFNQLTKIYLSHPVENRPIRCNCWDRSLAYNTIFLNPLYCRTKIFTCFYPLHIWRIEERFTTAGSLLLVLIFLNKWKLDVVIKMKNIFIFYKIILIQ